MTVMQSTIINMLIYIALVALGIFLGGRHLWGETFSRWLGKLQLASLLALIVALGIRLGADREVMGSLGQIGLSSLTITLFSMTGSLIAVTLLRRYILHLDRFGRQEEAAAETSSGSGAEEKPRSGLTKWIVTAVVAGMGIGYFVFSGEVHKYFNPYDTPYEAFINYMNVISDFQIRLDEQRAALDVKEEAIKETVAAGAGFGWYSLAPTLLAPYSLTLSAIAFLSNVLREIFSIIAIPIVSRSIGYLECVSLPGAAAMDTVLPVIVGATHERITVYAFLSGLILSLLVPILVPLIIAL